MAAKPPLASECQPISRSRVSRPSPEPLSCQPEVPVPFFQTVERRAGMWTGSCRARLSCPNRQWRRGRSSNGAARVSLDDALPVSQHQVVSTWTSLSRLRCTSGNLQPGVHHLAPQLFVRHQLREATRGLGKGRPHASRGQFSRTFDIDYEALHEEVKIRCEDHPLRRLSWRVAGSRRCSCAYCTIPTPGDQVGPSKRPRPPHGTCPGPSTTRTWTLSSVGSPSGNDRLRRSTRLQTRMMRRATRSKTHDAPHRKKSVFSQAKSRESHWKRSAQRALIATTCLGDSSVPQTVASFRTHGRGQIASSEGHKRSRTSLHNLRRNGFSEHSYDNVAMRCRIGHHSSTAPVAQDTHMSTRLSSPSNQPITQSELTHFSTKSVDKLAHQTTWAQ